MGATRRGRTSLGVLSSTQCVAGTHYRLGWGMDGCRGQPAVLVGPVRGPGCMGDRTGLRPVACVSFASLWRPRHSWDQKWGGGPVVVAGPTGPVHPRTGQQVEAGRRGPRRKVRPVHPVRSFFFWVGVSGNGKKNDRTGRRIPGKSRGPTGPTGPTGPPCSCPALPTSSRQQTGPTGPTGHGLGYWWNIVPQVVWPSLGRIGVRFGRA